MKNDRDPLDVVTVNAEDLKVVMWLASFAKQHLKSDDNRLDSYKRIESLIVRAEWVGGAEIASAQEAGK